MITVVCKWDCILVEFDFILCKLLHHACFEIRNIDGWQLFTYLLHCARLLWHIYLNDAILVLVDQRKSSFAARFVDGLICFVHNYDIVQDSEIICVQFLTTYIAYADVNELSIRRMSDTPNQLRLAVKQNEISILSKFVK